MSTARLTGVEAETQLGYAGLRRFLLPFAGQLERLPVPQRDALRGAFGLVAGPAADQLLVAAGGVGVAGRGGVGRHRWCARSTTCSGWTPNRRWCWDSWPAACTPSG